MVTPALRNELPLRHFNTSGFKLKVRNAGILPGWILLEVNRVPGGGKKFIIFH